MKIPASISIKLLLLILPLVSLPIAIVGYFSYQTALGIVTRMSQEEQMMLVKGAADKIETIFHSCKLDLEMISRIPFIEEYYQAKTKGWVTEAETNRKNLIRFFKYLLDRSPYYFQVRFINKNGVEMLSVKKERKDLSTIASREDSFYQEFKKSPQRSFYLSQITFSSVRRGYVLYFGKSFTQMDDKIIGTVVIDLDYDKMIELVKGMRVGEKGYAFLVDHLGRTIAHPEFAPYEMDLKNYPNPHLREFVINMMAGETGWMTYYYLGDRIASYTPIPTMGWSLAITTPIEEFKKEVQALQKKIFQVVLITLMLTGIVVIVLSHNFIKPVRRLVTAADRIAGGDLAQEIPVKSRDELGILTESFNRMMRNLKEIQNELVQSEKLISLGRLSAGVAHEIRNPLNAMKGAIVYLQRRRPEDPLLMEYTQIILELIDRLSSFATDFLHLAKQSPLRLMTSNLNELIQNTLTLFEEPMTLKGIALKKNLDPSLPMFPIDPHQMEQALINLLINAMDAMPQGGTLEIVTQRQAEESGTDKILLRLRDTGGGIPEAHRLQVLDPFFSTKEGGTGLGLPITLGIVESHGGKLAIQSEEGIGTVITIELPVNYSPLAKES